jgi:hypothetical protein
VLANYRSEHALNAEQLDLLRQVEELLVPETFELPVDPARLSHIEILRAKVSATLGRDAARAIFFAGGSDRTAGLPVLERIRYQWRRYRPQSVLALVNWVSPVALAIGCDCNETDDCAYYETCPNGEPGAPECNPSGWGCGPLNLQECWAKCYYPI